MMISRYFISWQSIWSTFSYSIIYWSRTTPIPNRS